MIGASCSLSANLQEYFTLCHTVITGIRHSIVCKCVKKPLAWVKFANWYIPLKVCSLWVLYYLPRIAVPNGMFPAVNCLLTIIISGVAVETFLCLRQELRSEWKESGWRPWLVNISSFVMMAIPTRSRSFGTQENLLYYTLWPLDIMGLDLVGRPDGLSQTINWWSLMFT